MTKFSRKGETGYMSCRQFKNRIGKGGWIKGMDKVAPEYREVIADAVNALVRKHLGYGWLLAKSVPYIVNGLETTDKEYVERFFKDVKEKVDTQGGDEAFNYILEVHRDLDEPEKIREMYK